MRHQGSFVLVLQHCPCEMGGVIEDALTFAGVRVEYLRTAEGQSVPKELGSACGLVVMGGPMGVYEADQYPFLRDEMLLIEHALKQGTPILGVCLGSQLLAATLGAPVTKGRQKEIGWYSITLTEEGKRDPLFHDITSPFVALEWHGDAFDLPAGAVHLASTDLTRYQAFRFGESAYGFLFHLEMTEPIIRAMVDLFTDELDEEGIEAEYLLQRMEEHLPVMQEVGRTVFRRWVDFLGANQES